MNSRYIALVLLILTISLPGCGLGTSSSTSSGGVVGATASGISATITGNAQI